MPYLYLNGSDKINNVQAMTPEQKIRYSSQISIPEFGADGQLQLLKARVLIIGLGGLGSPAALYLAAAGVGTLVISDFDWIELSNLQRQIMHRYVDIGESKAISAQRAIHALNPDCQVITKTWQLADQELTQEIQQADLVLDCSDNFATRFVLNKTCVTERTPLVSGAAIRQTGQVITFMSHIQGPCYQCLYPPLDTAQHDTCTRQGIIAPIVGIIGSMQALQAIQVLTGHGHKLIGRLLLFDAVPMIWRNVQVLQDPECPICSITI